MGWELGGVCVCVGVRCGDEAAIVMICFWTQQGWGGRGAGPAGVSDQGVQLSDGKN